MPKDKQTNPSDKPVTVPRGATTHILDRAYLRAKIRDGWITWPKPARKSDE